MRRDSPSGSIQAPTGGMKRVEIPLVRDCTPASAGSRGLRATTDVADPPCVARVLKRAGKWRLRATFNGTGLAAPSRSEYRELDVTSVLTTQT